MMYISSPTSKSAFPSPIILFDIKNNLLYNSKIKYVFNSKTKNYELRHYNNNKVNWKTSFLTPPLSVIKHWSKLFNNYTCINMRQAASNNPIHSSKHTDSTNYTQHNNLLSLYHKCNEDLDTTILTPHIPPHQQLLLRVIH